MKIAINDPFIEALVRDPRYEIRDDGTVWTTVCRTGKESLSGQWRQLALIESASGHLFIKYQRKHLAIHRVIFRKFLGRLRMDYAVNHIDGNKRNNTPENLELITHSENMLHCAYSGAIRPMIPFHSDRRFRSKPTVDSGAIRPVIHT